MLNRPLRFLWVDLPQNMNPDNLENPCFLGPGKSMFFKLTFLGNELGSPIFSWVSDTNSSSAFGSSGMAKRKISYQILHQNKVECGKFNTKPSANLHHLSEISGTRKHRWRFIALGWRHVDSYIMFYQHTFDV